MSRHRDIRNRAYSYDDDYGDEDDDDYYEDEEEYSAPQQASFASFALEKPKPIETPKVKPPEVRLPPEEAIIDKLCDQVRDILGNTYTVYKVQTCLRANSYKVDQTIECLLNESSALSASMSNSKASTVTSSIKPPPGFEMSPGISVKVLPSITSSSSNTSLTDLDSRGRPKDDSSKRSVGDRSRSPPRITWTAEEEEKLLPPSEKDVIKKDLISIVVIGHVDAGKSTLMGHLLYTLGYVNQRTINKYEKEAQIIGKATFHFAWVLDEHEEERSRGVTMDVGMNTFETHNKIVTLLDAPGHRDFIPSMISGVNQADVAILVVPAATGEFEAGFHADGQTREHATLARTLGITQLLIAVNKMDSAGWAQERFNEIVKEMSTFLNSIGYPSTKLTFVPVSGITGENLVKITNPDLMKWYFGSTLVDAIDSFAPVNRATSKPLRVSVTDVFKSSIVAVAGKVESGVVKSGREVLVMPGYHLCTIKNVTCQSIPVLVALAGENVEFGLAGIEDTAVSVGSVICPVSSPIAVTNFFDAHIQTFLGLKRPIIKGQQLTIFLQSCQMIATVTKLVATLDKKNEIKQKLPRRLVENEIALVQITLERPIPLELFSECKALGRFTLRERGQSIAAGKITKTNKKKKEG